MCPASSLIPGREQLQIKNLLKGFQALEYIFYMVSHLNLLSISFFIIFTSLTSYRCYNLHNKSII